MEIDTSQSSSTPKTLIHEVQDALAEDLMASPAVLESTVDVSMSPMKNSGSGSGSENLDDQNDYNSDSSYFDDNLSYYDEDFAFDNDNDDNDINLQAQFDAVDLPTGVELQLPWLEQPAKSLKPAAMSSSTVPNPLSSHTNKEKKENLNACMQQAGTSSVTALSQSSSCIEKQNPASSNSTLSGQTDTRSENEEKNDVDILEKYRLFKQFDTVQDYSDHHFSRGDSKSKQAPQKWTKTIQQEWKILEKDLPDTIFVRVYEERMDLLRAVIIGTPGTPYHDGLFFFDILFPSAYPDVPPQVFYYSGGLRLNPNLYDCGKVCLSLLNTWQGKKEEHWIPGTSTMLQVLLSIQALVLNEKPYFNEPGYEMTAGKREGEMHAQDYNENTFILSCKTMMYTLRRPPKYYEDFVMGHFLLRAHVILEACKAYMEGAQVGFSSGAGQDMAKHVVASKNLKAEVSAILPRMVQAFSRNGAKDCEQFLPTQT